MKLGLYIIHWKSGGTSEAAVGQMCSGRKWFAPTNWTADDGSDDWPGAYLDDWIDGIDKMEKVETK